MVASIDGKRLIKDITVGSIDEPDAVGKDLAKKLIAQGAGEILSEIFQEFRGK